MQQPPSGRRGAPAQNLATNPYAAQRSTNLNNNQNLPKIYDDNVVSRVTMDHPDPSPSRLLSYDNDNGRTDDYLSKWRVTEEQLSQDRRSRGMLENELQSTKLMINTLAAKFDLLQDQSRNESNTVRDMTRTFALKERETKDTVDMLTKKLDQESKRVHQLVEELTRSRQNDLVQGHQHQDQLRYLTEKYENLSGRMEGYSEKANQVGYNLSSASTQIQMESQRNEDTMKTIKMHDMALVSLTSNLDTNMEGFSRKIQMAAQDLFQKIETETKSRKGLEDSIRQDAIEFRRMIERHIAERVDSLHSYTKAQSEHDRLAIESVSNAFITKMQRLETSTSGSQEQFAGLVNQRLLNIEKMCGDAEVANKRMENRMQQSVTESNEFFETLVAKKDADGEKRIKDVGKSLLIMQKAIHESIQISERSMETKLKGLEEVLRAEISARQEVETKLSNLAHESTIVAEKHSMLIQKCEKLIDDGNQAQEKTLEIIKNVAQQLTKSQDRLANNFDGQHAKLSDAISKSNCDFFALINQIKSQMLQIHDDFATGVQENHSQVVMDAKERKIETEKLLVMVSNLRSGLREANEFEVKFAARSLLVDAALDVFKLELAARPTHSAIEDRITEMENEIEEERSALEVALEKLEDTVEENSQKDSLGVELLEDFKKIVDDRFELFGGRLAQTSVEVDARKYEQQMELQRDIDSRIEQIIAKHDELDDVITKQVSVLEEFKLATNEAFTEIKDITLSHETRIAFLIEDTTEQVETIKDEQKVTTEKALGRDVKLSGLKEELIELNEVLVRKIMESSDKNFKTSHLANTEIKKLNDLTLINKALIDKTHEQVLHNRESSDNHIKTLKQVNTDFGKRLDDSVSLNQTQSEVLSRKLSQLTSNLEGQNSQNQNDYLMMQEDLAFTKRLLGQNQEVTNSNAQPQLLLGDESTARLEIRFKSVEKQSLECKSQVHDLSQLFVSTTEQLDLKCQENHEIAEVLSNEMRLLKLDLNALPSSVDDKPNSAFENTLSAYEKPNTPIEKPNSAYEKLNSELYSKPTSAYDKPITPYEKISKPNSAYDKPSSAIKKLDSPFEKPTSAVSKPSSAILQPHEVEESNLPETAILEKSGSEYNVSFESLAPQDDLASASSRTSQVKSSQSAVRNLETPKSQILENMSLRTTPKSRLQTGESVGGTVYKPAHVTLNTGSGGTPRILSKSNLFSAEEERATVESTEPAAMIPLQHQASTSEF